MIQPIPRPHPCPHPVDAATGRLAQTPAARFAPTEAEMEARRNPGSMFGEGGGTEEVDPDGADPMTEDGTEATEDGIGTAEDEDLDADEIEGDGDAVDAMPGISADPRPGMQIAA